MLVCDSAANAVAAKSANEANVVSNMDFIVSFGCLCLSSGDLVYTATGFTPIICDLESGTGDEPYKLGDLCAGFGA